MNSMFDDCSSLTSINDLENLSTELVNNLSFMFKDCKSLESITFGREFTAKKATKFNEMFSGCIRIQRLDLSNFETEDVQMMNTLFQECLELKEII